MAQTMARLGIVLFVISLGIFVYVRVTAKRSNKIGGVPLYFPILLLSGSVIGALPLAFNLMDPMFEFLAGIVGFVLSLIALGIIIRHLTQTRT